MSQRDDTDQDDPRADKWLLLVYRIHSEPTRLRAGVWRELKGLGAIYIQNSAAALRSSQVSERALRPSRSEIDEMGGTGYLFECRALAGVSQLLGVYNAARDDEYEEVIDRCNDFRRQVAKEYTAEHFTYAGATAACITHDQSEAFALAHRIGVLEKGHLVQVSAPETIYAAPATPFVARFTGVATEVRSRVLRSTRSGGETVVDERPRLVSARPGPGHQGPAGWRGPPPRPAGRHTALSVSDEGCHAVGTVREVAFRGRGYEVALDLRGGGRVSTVAANTWVSRGESVGLHLEKAGCLVLESTGPYDAAAGNGQAPAGEEPAQRTKNEPTPSSTGGRTMP